MRGFDKIAAYFNITLDELVHLGEDLPKVVSIEDKTTAKGFGATC